MELSRPVVVCNQSEAFYIPDTRKAMAETIYFLKKDHSKKEKNIYFLAGGERKIDLHVSK
ncbi:hypothetical protein [Dethiosulfatarculus sandiegensis]|uniref:Uncharacterized protein n=1 Tax=Dethiosulfatarculus sandiegensis TaxID=1429043 RepID=A0A0D2JA40_9BACT|nr:hypothetical protein [Dethiosulfatarculus sandiegensis]KIX12556.1 hypothetical protein X474_18300 [Dethiosulfatarculus sandiegensis]